LDPNPTRRQVIKSALGGAAGVLFGAQVRAFGAQASAIRSEAEPLGNDLFLIRTPGEANVVAQVSSAGVLLVDGGSAQSVGMLTGVLSRLPGGGDVHTLFNTHWHPEQTGLNEQIGKAGRTIIAHENTRLWLTTDVTWPWIGRQFKRLPKIAQPNKTFYTNGKLDSGTQYGYISDAAHTDGDLYVYFPQQNVLAVGDVLSNQGWPVVDWVSGGWIAGIVGGLQRISTIGNDKTVIVPGRGPVMTMADLKTHYDMYGAIYDRLSKLLNSGRGPTEAVDAKPANGFVPTSRKGPR